MECIFQKSVFDFKPATFEVHKFTYDCGNHTEQESSSERKVNDLILFIHLENSLEY